MKLLITGGCGFLGSNLANYWLQQGADVVIIDALYRQGSASNLAWLKRQALPRSISFYERDLAVREGVEPVFAEHAPFDYVCHLGGQVAMTTSLRDPTRDLMTNVVGTFNVLECVRKYSPGALIAYSSTNKVYGDLAHLTLRETPTRYELPDYPGGLNESTPLDFASPYGCSKGAADQYVRDWHRNFGLNTVVFRHSSIYGGRQYSTFDQGWIGWFCQKAIEQKHAQQTRCEPEAFTISGTGKQVRDVLHAEDLIRLYRLAWDHRADVSGEIFNIGGGIDNSLSLLELFSLLEDMLGFGDSKALTYVKQPRRQSDQDVFVADISKAHRLMGWAPKVGTRDGIGRMLQWLSSEGRTG